MLPLFRKGDSRAHRQARTVTVTRAPRAAFKVTPSMTDIIPLSIDVFPLLTPTAGCYPPAVYI